MRSQDTEIAAVDLVYLNEYADNDKDFIKELISVFLETSGEHMALLKGHISDGENMVWSETAHSLKGSAAFLGAEKMRLLCAVAQNMKIASISEREDLYDQIQSAYNDVLAFLNNYCSKEFERG